MAGTGMAGTAIVWVAEGTWPACVDAARQWVPDGDDVVLLHVAGGEVTAAHGALAGLLGRGCRGPGDRPAGQGRATVGPAGHDPAAQRPRRARGRGGR